MWSLQAHVHGVPSASREMRVSAKTVPAGALQQGLVRTERLAQQDSRLQKHKRQACAVKAGDSSSNGYNRSGSCLSDDQQVHLQKQLSHPADQQKQLSHPADQWQQQHKQHVYCAHAFFTAEPSDADADAIATSRSCSRHSSHRFHSPVRLKAVAAAADGSAANDDASLDLQPHSSAAVHAHTDQQQNGISSDIQDAAAVSDSSSSTPGTAGHSLKQRRPQQHGKESGSNRRRPHGTSKNKSRPSRSSSAVSSLYTSKLLTTAISSSTSWQQLQHLLQQDGEHMNHIHACALLSTTSRLVQYSHLPLQEQQHFGDFYVAALQLAFARVQDSAGPREVASMLWAVAKVGLHPGAAWLAAYLQAAAPHLERMNAQDLGLLAWSLARFRHQPEPQWQQQLLHTTQQRMRNLDPQGLCNLLWGLATLDIQPDLSWVDAAVAAAGSHMSNFQPQGLAVTLWAVAKLGCRPAQAWLQDAAEAASRQLMLFKPAELAMLCHALARMHYQPHSQQQEQQLLWQVQSVSHKHMQNLRFSEAANMLWALGVRGQQVQPIWMTAALQQLAATVQQADGKALANAIYGLAKLQHRPQQEWWEVIWQQLPYLLPVKDANSAVSSGMHAPESATTAEALADWSSSGKKGVQSPAVPAETAADCQAQVTLVLSIAKLGVEMPPQVAALLLQATQLQLRLHAMNSAEVCGVAMAAAKLKLQVSQQWLAAVDSALEALLLLALSDKQQHEQHTAATSRQRQQQQWQEQQQQQGHNHPLKVQPKEVSNTLLSLARLRYMPSDGLLQAVQRYQQEYSEHLQEAERQLLGRAVQSAAARKKHVQQQQQQQQALAAAAVPVSSSMSGTPSSCHSSNACTRQEPADASFTVAADEQEKDTSSRSSKQHVTIGEPRSGGLNGAQHVSRSCSSSAWHNGSNSSSCSSGDCWLEVGKYVLHVHSRQGSTLLQGSNASNVMAADGQLLQGASQGTDTAASCKVVPVLLGGRL